MEGMNRRGIWVGALLGLVLAGMLSLFGAALLGGRTPRHTAQDVRALCHEAMRERLPDPDTARFPENQPDLREGVWHLTSYAESQTKAGQPYRIHYRCAVEDATGRVDIDVAR